MPRVSVLMTAYNSEKYISEAIESVLTQTYKDFEFIIINDGSTDNTAKIVKEYAKKDKRIKFINNKRNQGLIAVLNQGLKLCAGEYIARMDADDISLPERFTKQVAYLNQYPEVGVLGTAIQQFGKGNKKRSYRKEVKYLDLCYWNPLCHPTVMMRKSVLDKYDIKYNPEYKAAEDYKIWADLIKVTQIHNLPNVLLKYRIHASSICATENTVQMSTTRRIQKELQEFLTDIPEFKHRTESIIHDYQFYDKYRLSKHMFLHHPWRWLKLKHQKKSSKQVEIYICNHKEFPNAKSDALVPMHVGAACHNYALDMLTDNTGDNISELNPFFCELTATYWIWKNSTADIVGLFHYRRYLNLKNDADKCYLPTETIASKYGLTAYRVEELLKDKDIILPELGGNTPKSLYEYYSQEHCIKDMDIALEVIKKLYPKQYKTAYEVLHNHKQGYFCNMLIARKEVFDIYAKWLFSILFEVQKKIQPQVKKRTQYQQRVYGFLSERLMTVFIALHPELKKGEAVLVDIEPDSKIYHKWHRKYIKHKVLEALLLRRRYKCKL